MPTAHGHPTLPLAEPGQVAWIIHRHLQTSVAIDHKLGARWKECCASSQGLIPAQRRRQGLCAVILADKDGVSRLHAPTQIVCLTRACCEAELASSTPRAHRNQRLGRKTRCHWAETRRTESSATTTTRGVAEGKNKESFLPELGSSHTAHRADRGTAPSPFPPTSLASDSSRDSLGCCDQRTWTPPRTFAGYE